VHGGCGHCHGLAHVGGGGVNIQLSIVSYKDVCNANVDSNVCITKNSASSNS